MKSTKSTKSTFISIIFYYRGIFSLFAILSIIPPIVIFYCDIGALDALGAAKGNESLL